MPQKGFAHIFLILLLLLGVGAGIYLVQHPAIFKPRASEVNNAPTVPQTPPTLAFVFIGESNSGGFGLNKDAKPEELAKTSSVQILNNYSLKFEDLAFVTSDPNSGPTSNNTLDHVGIQDDNDNNPDPNLRAINRQRKEDHGLELQLAKSVKESAFPNNPKVYLVKTGQGGSGVYAWNSSDEVNFPYWRKFKQRISAAKSFLYPQGKPVQWVVWYSLGINDRSAVQLPVADYKAQSLDLINKIKGELPGAIIIMTQFQAQHDAAIADGNRIYYDTRPGHTSEILANYSQSHFDFTEYNAALSQIAQTEKNVYVVDTTGASLNIAGSDPKDLKHWDYAGFKAVGSKMVDITKNALQTVNILSASPNPCILNASGTCSTRISWNFPGISDLKITLNPGNATLANQQTNGSSEYPFITASGATFDAYSGDTLIRSLFVKGADSNPTGTISASPCTIPTGGTRCSSTITWSTFNTTGPVQVRNPNGVWSHQIANGSSTYDYVSTTPVTFQLFDGTDNSHLLGSVTVQATAPTGQISATPCSLTAGKTTCNSTITWSTTNAAGPVKVTIKETNGLFAQAGNNGSQDFPWVSSTPLTMQLMDGDNPTPLSTVVVQASTVIKAINNPCTLSAIGKCTSTITWSAAGYPDFNIYLLENNLVFDTRTSGSLDINFVTANGATFQARSGNTVIDSVVLKGH